MTGTNAEHDIGAWACIEDLLPFVLIVGVLIWFFRRSRKQMGGGLGGIMGIGRSKAKVYDEDKPTTRFADIAGYEGSKAEVMEVVDFLKYPQRYAAAGAVGPKGVLMVGPPGTGKTLMARAVAGEAGVPFFALSGSSFVEMFVGVGASRVRDLFADARKRSPGHHLHRRDRRHRGPARPGGFRVQRRARADAQPVALGHGRLRARRQRGRHGRHQPGRDPRHRPAAARAFRPDGGDPAAQPGRAHGHPRPYTAGARSSRRDVDLDAVSRGTPGFSGADLANLVNEAAINAVRARRDILTAADFDAARDRLLIGRRDASNALLPEEKHSVAVHEAGHALVAALSEHADPVAKVTILPRGAALGVTEQLPVSERHLYPQSYLTDSLTVRLGGRAAEILVLGRALDGSVQRPRRRHRPGHAHGPGMGVLH